MPRIEGPVTEEEYEEVREAARKAGLSMRRYVTQAALKGIRETPIQDQIEVVASCVAQVASNIQPLATMHQSLLVLHAEMAMATRSILETQTRVEQALQAIDQGHRKLGQMGTTIEAELRDHRQEALNGFKSTNLRLERLTSGQNRQNTGPRVYTPTRTLDGEDDVNVDKIGIPPKTCASLQ
jgi:uncharacterized protein YhaN